MKLFCLLLVAFAAQGDAALYAEGELGVDACDAGYTSITDAATCETAAGALGLTYAGQFSTGAGVCNLCGGCSVAKGKNTVRVDATHGAEAKWICQNVYAMGEEGVDACPAGYEKITEDVACGTAAGYLGLTYAPEFNSGSGLCNLCGGCSVAKGKDTVRVDATHGGSAFWLCALATAA